MRLLPLLAAVLLGCPASPLTTGWEDSFDDCVGNSPPFLANVEFAFLLVPPLEPLPDPPPAPTFLVGVHFDWADPGVAEAADPPNLWNGELTAELGGTVALDVPDYRLDEQRLVSTCVSPLVGDLLGQEACEAMPFSFTGCTPGDLEACSQGELNLGPLGPEGGYAINDFVALTFRIVDRCGLPSADTILEFPIPDPDAEEQ